MKIESYSFGNIQINGKKFTHDIIILEDKIIDSWWRKDGHKLLIADIENVLDKKPDLLIIGTGAYGVLKVQQETIDYFNNNGIKFVIEKTEAAVKIYNKESADKLVYAALHLTC